MPPNVIRPSGIPYSSAPPDFFYGPPVVTASAAPGLANFPPPPIPPPLTPMNMEPYFSTDYSSIPFTQHHPSLSMHPSALYHSNPTDSLMMNNWPTDVYMPSETEMNYHHQQQHFYNPCVTSQHLSSFPVNSNMFPASNHQVTNTTTTTAGISSSSSISYHQSFELNDYTSSIDLPIGTFDNQMSYASNPIDDVSIISKNNSGGGGSNNQLPSDEQVYHIPLDEDASIHF
ncbi:unnamed protein product [Trichobilharzia regenti]|nr:unnamed protein product [Trichobilharzia regenti]